MKTRHLVRSVSLRAIVSALALSFGGPALAQSSAHGQPDIQGVWTNFDPTPFEAPNDIDLERLAPLAAWFPGDTAPAIKSCRCRATS